MGRPALHWACVFALGAVALLGCQEVVEFKTYRFNVTESRPNLSVLPSAGVEICQVDTVNCDTTDALGMAELHVPPNQEVAFTLEKEGYGPRLLADVSDETFGQGSRGDGQPDSWRMYPHDQLAAIAEQLQTRYPWEGGIVGLNVNGHVAGWTFTPVGSTIDAVGEPFYLDELTEEYRLDLEATPSVLGATQHPLAEGGFTEVIPGEQQFEFGGTGGDCSRLSFGWPGDTPNTIRLPVRDGYITYGSMGCEDP